MKRLFDKYKFRLITTLFIVVIIFLLNNIYKSNIRLSQYKNQIEKFDVKEQKFNEIIKSNKSKIIEQEQIFLSERDAMRNNLLVADNKLKRIKNQLKYKTTIQLDSVFIPFTDTIVSVDSNFKSFFSLKNQHYSISGVSQSNGVLINSISLPNKMTITIGSKKQGLFKKALPIVKIDNSNPYIVNNSLSNITIKNDLKWYEKRSNWLLVGVISGVGLGIIITK